MFSNINSIYEYINFIANKNQSGSISPNEFNISINAAQQEYLRIKLGLTELYSVQKRESPQQFQATQSISDSLRPFIVTANIQKNGNGFDLPPNFAAWGNSDYLYVQQVNGQNYAVTQPMEFVTLSERAIRLNNYIIYPTLEYPIATYLNNQIVVDPTDVTGITFSYVRYPVTPIWAYTLVNDEPVYDNSNSVQLEFPNLDWENIAYIVLKYYGIFLRDTELYSTSDNRIKTGE